MKKLIAALIFGLLAHTALANEESANFFGAGIGSGTLKFKYESGSYSYDSPDFTSTRITLLGGRKQFINSMLGFRYGVLLDMIGTKYTKGSAEGEAGGIDIFADALFNFLNFEKFSAGVFGGVALGWAQYNGDSYAYNKNDKTNGFDFAINLGARTNFLTHHGVELYYRLGFVETKGEYTNGDTIKFKRPSQFGVRYIYSF